MKDRLVICKDGRLAVKVVRASDDEARNNCLLGINSKTFENSLPGLNLLYRDDLQKFLRRSPLPLDFASKSSILQSIEPVFKHVEDLFKSGMYDNHNFRLDLSILQLLKYILETTELEQTRLSAVRELCEKLIKLSGLIIFDLTLAFSQCDHYAKKIVEILEQSNPIKLVKFSVFIIECLIETLCKTAYFNIEVGDAKGTQELAKLWLKLNHGTSNLRKIICELNEYLPNSIIRSTYYASPLDEYFLSFLELYHLSKFSYSGIRESLMQQIQNNLLLIPLLPEDKFELFLTIINFLEKSVASISSNRLTELAKTIRTTHTSLKSFQECKKSALALSRIRQEQSILHILFLSFSIDGM